MNQPEPKRKSIYHSPVLRPNEINAALKDKAKEMYINGAQSKLIKHELGITHDVLSRWIEHEDWSLDRRIAETRVIEKYAKDKIQLMSHIGGLSLRTIIYAIEERIKTKEKNPITIQEAKLISDIFSSLDKIIKLDTGKPTDHVQHISVSLQDIRDALVDDKFIDIIPTHKETP